MIDAENDATQAFRTLDPHAILDAVDSTGWQTDGRVSALNSYENRVYSLGLESGDGIVAKFYRPGRWRDDTILEEHAFCADLLAHDIPVIAPLADAEGCTLHRFGPFRFSLYPRVGGRPPELDNPEQLAVIGRSLGRMHLVADTWHFQYRPLIDPGRLGDDCADYLLEADMMSGEQADVYESLIDELLPEIHARFAGCPYQPLSLHGDFHPGNILWGRDDTPQLLDFDDAATGPAVQDLWMFLSGERAYAQARLGDLLDGYHEFREFDERELSLIEPLRTLRIIHYAAWIAQRWQDPAFKKAFPFFAEARFWDEHVQSLREQCAALERPPLIY